MTAASMGRIGAGLALAPSMRGLDEQHRISLFALERTRVPMAVTDPHLPDNPIVLANRAFLEMTGYAGEEVIGRNCRFLQGPDTDPATIDQLRAAIAARQEIMVEILNYHRDGKPFWNQLLVSPVSGDDGDIRYFFASQLDVTGRRAAQELEAAEHLLLKEVDHRAKNALALVQSIMRLTRANSAESYAHVVQGRVDTLARAHALLAEGRWRGVPLAALIKGEVAPFGSRRVRTSGPAVSLGSAQVQPLSLLLHEMLENASRHGALAAPGGMVHLDWSPGEDELILHWREIGGHAIGADAEPALGLTLVRTMLERQLRGRSAFRWQASGLEAEFAFPTVRGGLEPV